MKKWLLEWIERIASVAMYLTTISGYILLVQQICQDAVDGKDVKLLGYLMLVLFVSAPAYLANKLRGTIKDIEVCDDNLVVLKLIDILFKHVDDLKAEISKIKSGK